MNTSQLQPDSLTVKSDLLVAQASEDLQTLEQRLRSDSWLAVDSVHNIRVLSKRLRAWWRLWRQSGLNAQALQANQQLRQLSHQLAALRDAQVLPQQSRILADIWLTHPRFSVSAPLLLRLADRLMCSQSLIVPPGRARLLTLLQQQGDLLRNTAWPTELGVEIPLAASVGDLQRTAARAFKLSSAEAFHEWRKRIKTLYYQCLMLESLGSGLTVAFQPELKRLATELGELHDLDNLLRCLSGLEKPGLSEPALATLQAELLGYQQLQRLKVAELYLDLDLKAFNIDTG